MPPANTDAAVQSAKKPFDPWAVIYGANPFGHLVADPNGPGKDAVKLDGPIMSVHRFSMMSYRTDLNHTSGMSNDLLATMKRVIRAFLGIHFKPRHPHKPTRLFLKPNNTNQRGICE